VAKVKSISNLIEIEDDLPTLSAIDISAYVNPDPDGDGVAYNGKPVLTPEQAGAQIARSGALWNVGPNGQITYSFLDKPPSGQYNSNSKKVDAAFADDIAAMVADFSPFTAEQRDAAREAFGLWDDLIAPSFVEKNGRGAADINLMNTGTSGPAQAAAFQPFYSGGHGRFAKIQGDVYISSTPTNSDLFYGGYGQTTLVHEIGHSIGLSHPGDYNFAIGRFIDYGADAEYFQDSLQYSIMSYFETFNTGVKGWVNWYTGYAQTPQTPMIHDIVAVQSIYGADPTTRVGDTSYGFNATAGIREVFDFTVNKNPFVAIYDAGGHDTLDLSGWSVNSVLDLNEGGFSSGYATPDIVALNATHGTNFNQATWNAIFAGQFEAAGIPGFLSDNISIAYGTIIEDGITGSGNDRLIGNQVANRLDGGRGQDSYTGGGGADTFVIKDRGSVDILKDFKSGEDKVDLSAFGIDASDLNFVGKDVFVDVDNNGSVDLIIRSEADAIKPEDIIFG
jgi:serralysin